MPASKITLEHAKQDKLFYFVVNVIVYRQTDGRCLILKRSASEKVFPGRYCVPGGKAEHEQFDLAHPTSVDGDVVNFADPIGTIARAEVKQEAGIEIGTEFRIVSNTAFVRPDGIPVILLKVATTYEGGEVQLEAGSFEGHAWVNSSEVKEYDCIDGVADEIAKAIALYRN